MHFAFASLMPVLLAFFPPAGFRNALIDFAYCVGFLFLADANYKPAQFYRWLFFVLSVIFALLFFLAGIIDLGAHIDW